MRRIPLSAIGPVLWRSTIVGLSPRTRWLKTVLGNGAVLWGRNQSGHGGRGVFIFRENLEPEIALLGEWIGPESVFVDVGANTGLYTVYAARQMAGQGTVVSVEPNPEMFSVLTRNVRANGFTNVITKNLCLGDYTGPATLWENFNKPNSYSLLQRDTNASPLTVSVQRLDDLVREENLNRLDYLKLDVEGAEQQVLAGGSKSLERFRPVVQLETTVQDVQWGLPHYSAFQLEKRSSPLSPNRLYIPDEHPKRDVPLNHGWTRSRIS